MSALPIKRETFATSRLLDFFSEKELVAQIGHSKADWPLVAIKELLDNALDACEEAGIVPEITVTVTPGALSMQDNGPGLSADMVARILDYSVRISSREAYCEPARGAQGNAWKTLVAMPFVLSGNDQGGLTVRACGVEHHITVRVDRIRQTPVIQHQTAAAPQVQTGTFVQIHWPRSAVLTIKGLRPNVQIGADLRLFEPASDADLSALCPIRRLLLAGD